MLCGCIGCCCGYYIDCGWMEGRVGLKCGGVVIGGKCGSNTVIGERCGGNMVIGEKCGGNTVIGEKCGGNMVIGEKCGGNTVIGEKGRKGKERKKKESNNECCTFH